MKLHISENLWLPLDAVTQTQIVYGGKGMGKTNLAAVLCEELHKNNLKFSLLDPLGVNWGLQYGRTKDAKGLAIVILGGIHGDIAITPNSGAIVAEFVSDESVSTVVDISRNSNGTMWSHNQRIQFVTDYCRRLFEKQGEQRVPIMQLVDEAGRFCPQLIPAGARDLAYCVSEIEQLVEWGRNVGIGVTLITQRSARMNKSVSELAEIMYAFRTIGPHSLEAVMDWLGDHVPKEKIREYSEKVRSLPRGSALVISPGWLKFEAVAQIRLRETFDSSKTPEPGKNQVSPGKASKPDLEKYRQRMVETEEKAKADDPRALRMKIASLEQELRRSDRNAAKDEEEIEVAENRGYERAVEEYMPYKDEAIRWRQVIHDIETALENVPQETPVVVKNIVDPAKKRLFSSGTVAPGPTEKPLRSPIKYASGPGLNLPQGERAVLTCIAQYTPTGGATREQITILTGYKRSSRDTYIQRLYSKDYIHLAAKDRIQASPVGLAALGSYEPLPTGKRLIEYWLNRLPAGEKALFEKLVEAHGGPIHRDLLSENTGYKRSSRDTYLQRLSARQLVVVMGAGLVAAPPFLFER